MNSIRETTQMTDDDRRPRRRLKEPAAVLVRGGGDVYVAGRFSAGTDAVCFAYFAYKQKTPRADALLPLQKRMESGGA
jgi:hypothetical protein